MQKGGATPALNGLFFGETGEFGSISLKLPAHTCCCVSTLIFLDSYNVNS